jgi:arylsulfatase A-like enzyme
VADGAIPFENGFLSEVLLGQGYNTFAAGKWHLTPSAMVTDGFENRLHRVLPR